MPKRNATVSEQLRKAIKNYGSVYRVAKDSGVAQPVVLRFANGERGLTTATVDTLCEFFGMQLTEPTVRSAVR